MMSVGLILEGGGMRGLFTAGVMDVLLENNIDIDTTVGVSAGAIFGSNIKSEQIGRVLRFNLKYCQDPRYFSLKSFLTTGDLFGADFCYNLLTYELDPFDVEHYRNHPMKFYAVTTNLESGTPEYHLCPNGTPDDMQWIRASATMPLVSKPVAIENNHYMDGGVTDPIPVKFGVDLGLDKLIVVRTQPENYVRQPIMGSWLAKSMYKQYPNFLDAFLNQHKIYNEEVEYIKKLEKEGKVFVIQPDNTLPANTVDKDPDNLQENYNQGREIASRNLEDLKDFLAG